MALPNATTTVSSSVTLTLNDLLPTNNPQVFNRIVPPILFKAALVQYQGYISIIQSSSFSFSPPGPFAAFAVVYVRNTGPNVISLSLTPTGGLPNTYGLDPGTMVLWTASAPLSSTIVTGTTQPGISVVSGVTGANATAVVEVLLAA